VIFRPGARSLAVAAAILSFLPLSCADRRLSRESLSIVRADGNAVVIDCEMARTEAEQETGYMGRKKIPEGTGMLFAFRSDEKLSFWMKNTPHPLSIAYIDSSGVIREIHDMTPYSLEAVSSERSLRYALEVPQGWFTRAGIAVGDRLSPESLAIAAGTAVP
jgi:uncharacterized membrane protein (UPF0127 family)